MNLEKLSDKELMHLMENGEKEKAFNVLYNRYYSDLYRFLYYKLDNTIDSEDLTQETFIRLFMDHTKFRHENNASFKTWLYHVAINIRIDYYRKEGSLRGLLVELMGAHELTPQKITEKREKETFFIDCCEKLRKLDAQSYDLLSLIYFGGYSYQQVSDEMRMPMGTVKINIYRAKSNLKKLFLKHNKNFSLGD